MKQVIEPVNTTRTGRASISAKRVLLAPEEYLQALDLRNFSFRIIFLHLFDTIIHARHFDMYKSGEKYGINIVKQVVEPVNTTRTGRASISAKRVLLDPEEYLQALDLRNFSFRNIFLHFHPPLFFILLNKPLNSLHCLSYVFHRTCITGSDISLSAFSKCRTRNNGNLLLH